MHPTGSNTLDGTRYPLLHAYLRGLPNGIDSYPECRMVADVMRDLQREYAPQINDDALPERIRIVLNDVAPEGDMTSIVAVAALPCLLRDSLGFSEARILDRAHQRAMVMLDKPLYRALFHVLSPNMLLLGASHRWSTFYQGTTLRSHQGGERSHVLRLTYPPGLFNETSLKLISVLLCGVLRMANARGVHAKITTLSATEAEFLLGWA